MNQSTSRIRQNTILLGGAMSVARLCHLTARPLPADIQFSIAPDSRRRMEAAVDLVQQAVDTQQSVYGVTTGFGAMASQAVPSKEAAASQNNLLSFLAAGAGPPMDSRHVRAAMLLRANMLAQGCSGVRPLIVERLVQFLEADACPVVRELGSIGASGDLVPLSTIARAVVGSPWVRVELNGQSLDGPAALASLGLEPLELQPKEGLAIVNGTSFSAAIAAHATNEATQLTTLALVTQSMMLHALQAHAEPFADFVHQHKPHPGQVWVADIMKQLLQQGRAYSNGKPANVQDRYSLRCLPQYYGPIIEGLVRVRRTVEIEMNAVSDNPLVDVEHACFYQSGNFLGQQLGVAMDDLRRMIGLLAKHIDVQIASIVSPAFNNGLPSSLRGNDDRAFNMGLKGLQITGNSIMPMLTYLGNPLVDHYPTHAEQFNQNINGLSWGAAQLAQQSVLWLRHYMTVAAIFAVQAVDLRAHASLGHYDGRAILGSLVTPVYEAICSTLGVQPTEDRPLLFDDTDLWLEQKMETMNEALEEGGPLRTSYASLFDALMEEQLEAASRR